MQFAALALPGGAACAKDDNAALAQQLANPIADLTVVPFQYDLLLNGGPDGDATGSVLTIQPIIPIHLNKDWNLITRTILPVAYASGIPTGDFGGLGDTQFSAFLSPQKSGADGLVWGIGSIVNLPTATNSDLGTSEWGAGPTAVALVQKGPWTVGALANHLWTFDDAPAGAATRSLTTTGAGYVDQTFTQPWVTYGWGSGQSVTLTSQTSYNWNSDEWTVPLNLTYQSVGKLGDQSVQFQVGGAYAPIVPDDYPNWGLQASLIFLFPN
ncbi:hypothetical protein [Methyloceanibacter methanicus]|nr:hypothetical protein [Methyloceanibacter methanicus]